MAVNVKTPTKKAQDDSLVHFISSSVTVLLQMSTVSLASCLHAKNRSRHFAFILLDQNCSLTRWWTQGGLEVWRLLPWCPLVGKALPSGMAIARGSALLDTLHIFAPALQTARVWQYAYIICCFLYQHATILLSHLTNVGKSDMFLY